jgi:translation initiation factor IF-2
LSKETKNNQTEKSAIDGLKKLSLISTSEQVPHLLKEIQSAKRSLEGLYQSVSEKRRRLINQEQIKEAAKKEANLDEKQTASKTFSDDKKQETDFKQKEDAQKSQPQKNTNNIRTQTPNTRPASSGYQGNNPRPSYQGNNQRPTSSGYQGNNPRPNYQNNNSRTGYQGGNNSGGYQGKAPYQPSRPAFTPKNDVIEEVITPTEVRNKFANNNTKQKNTSYDSKNKALNKKQLMRRNLILNEAEQNRLVMRKPKRKQKEQVIAPLRIIDRAVITTDNLTVKLLAENIGKPVNEIIKKLFLLGVMATINSVIDFDTAELVSSELGVTLEKNIEKTYEEKLTDLIADILKENPKELKPRAPIVTVMGHVDHGKTSLLDAIRKTSVTSAEAGGITQHIGAYMVKTDKGKITFIDTPGHAAFTEMRARGAKVTDIAILVVAADDGIMPQTVEAINHIKAAEVSMVVAINKIDKPGANIEKVKQQLADQDVLAEDWGGDTIMVPVSAYTQEGLDKLLDMILLVAEVKELKANPKRAAIGTIIEAKLDKGRGPTATIIVQNGTLKVGDSIIAGVASGRIRAMIDDQGNEIKQAPPATPVAVVGFDSVPEAGDFANVVSEKMIKELVLERVAKAKENKQNTAKAVDLEDLFSKVKAGAIKSFNVIIKGGVAGMVEALKQSLEKIKNEEVKINCVHAAAGAINENDVLLAQTTNSVIIGFNVKPDVNAKRLAEKLGVDIRFYDIIYRVIEDLELAIKGMLAPKFEEVVIGHAEVRALYKISKVGTIAGCAVKDGKITKNSKVRIMRNNVVVVDTTIDTLKKEKDDVKEVKSGFECGIKFTNFNDLKEGDIIEAYIDQEIKQ